MRPLSICIIALALALPASASDPIVQTSAIKLIASDFFSDNSGWPFWGPEANGAYYYPTGWTANDPQSGQTALFLLVQGGQSDAANLYIDDPSSQYSNCAQDEAIQLVIPGNKLGIRGDLIGSVFTPQNTIRISTCGDYWGPGTTFLDYRINTRFIVLNSNDAHIEMIESGPSLGSNQFRSWTNRQTLVLGKAVGADTPIQLILTPTQSYELWTGQVREIAEWDGLVRFQDDSSNPGALDVGRAKLRWSPTLYGSSNPWRLFFVDSSNNWHMVNPTTKIVDFDLKKLFGAKIPTQIFRNENSWYEAWHIFFKGRGAVPPTCSIGSSDYRRGFNGETLGYYRYWSNAAPSASPFAASFIELQSAGTPFSPNRPAWLDYATGREGAFRFNHGGTRYLISAHNDTNICDPQVGTNNPYQGLYVTLEELSYYDSY